MLLSLDRRTQSGKSTGWSMLSGTSPGASKEKGSFSHGVIPKVLSRGLTCSCLFLTLPEMKSIQSRSWSLAFLILRVRQPQLLLVCLGHSNLEPPETCITGYEVIPGRCCGCCSVFVTGCFGSRCQGLRRNPETVFECQASLNSGFLVSGDNDNYLFSQSHKILVRIVLLCEQNKVSLLSAD